MSQSNSRNIEIKAKLFELEDFNEKINIARKLTQNCKPMILTQRDVFFNTLCGRLKLRHEKRTTSKLIHYERNDIEGPKLSKFNVLEVEDGKLMEMMLSNSIGSLGVLEKTRYLFMYDRTRIHLDIVKNMEKAFYGLEFEVKLEPDEDIEVGNKIAEELMQTFKINKDQLLKESYFEILNTQK